LYVNDSTSRGEVRESRNTAARNEKKCFGTAVFRPCSPLATQWTARGFPAARSSPAVAEGKVVTLGVQGTLSCLDAEKGTVVWRKDSTGATPGFSTSSSPLLADGLCVVQVGGDRGGSVIAYHPSDGKEKWRWTSDGTKYASPMLLSQDNHKAVVVETAGTITAVNQVRRAAGLFLPSPRWGEGRKRPAARLTGATIWE